MTRDAPEPRIVLRPRTFLGSIDLALRYLALHRRTFAIGAVATVPLAGLPALALALGLSIAWGAAAALFLLPWVEHATLLVGASHVLGGTVTWRAAAARCLRRPLVQVASGVGSWLPVHLILLSSAQDMFLGLGVLLALVWPGATSLAVFLPHVLLLENQCVDTASGRCGDLLRGRRGRAFGLVLLGGAARLAFVAAALTSCTFIAEVLLQLGSPGSLWESPLLWVVASLAFCVAGVALAVVRLMEYVDARTELEGWDLQVRFRRLAARPEGERWAA